MDKAKNVGTKLKDNIVDVKEKSEQTINKEESNIEYATNKVNTSITIGTEKGIKLFLDKGQKSVINTKDNISRTKIKIKDLSNKRKIKRKNTNIKKGTKHLKIGNKTIKNTKKAQKISKESIKAQKRMVEASKQIIKNVKVAIKVVIKTIKGIVLGTKALIDLIVAGGWIVVVIIVILCVIGMIFGSFFGIFFSNEASDNNITMNSVIMEINNELSAKIEEEKKNKEYDEVSINSNISNWKEVFALYSVLNSSKNEDSITIDDKKKEELKKIFWQFNSIKSYIKEENRDTSIVKVLYIEINSKDITNMENLYKLSYEEREEVAELLSEDYSSMWQSLIIGSVNELGWIFPVKDVYVITTYYSEIHQAIDIASNYNTNIYAITSGTVIISKGGCIAGDITCNGKAGNYIVISHDDGEYYSKYMHLNKINVKEGDKVNIGDIIGTMGNTGNVIPLPTRDNPLNGTHLHFVIEKESSSGRYPIDPNLFYCY